MFICEYIVSITHLAILNQIFVGALMRFVSWYCRPTYDLILDENYQIG